VHPQPFHSRLLSVGIGELLNKGATVAAFIWIARTLEPAVYGQVEWALSVAVAALLVADAGLALSATAEASAHPREVPVLAARVAWLRLTLAIPIYGLVLAAAWLKGGPAGYALAIYGLNLFLQPLIMQYVFDGLLQTRFSALGSAVRGTTFLAAVLLLVHAHSQPAAVAAAEVLGTLALVACNALVVRQVFRLRIPFAAGRPGMAALFARTWPVGASDVLWGVQTYSGLILLGYMAAPQETAWHSSSLRLMLAIHTGVLLYLTTLLPNLSRLAGEPARWTRVVEQSVRFTGWIGCGIALVCTLGAPTIVTTVFGAPFAAAVTPFRLLIWVVPISWLSGHFRYSLIAARHPELEYRARLVGAGTTIGMTLALVPSLKSAGSALALLLGTIANAIAAWAFMRGVLPRGAFAKSMAASSLCCAVCLLVGFAAMPAIGQMPATLLAAAITTAAALAAERHELRDLLQTVFGGTARADAAVESGAGAG